MSDTAMTPNDLRLALKITWSTFYKYQAKGQFESFELKPRIGPHRYSRKLVQAYLDRELQSAAPRGRVAAMAR